VQRIVAIADVSQVHEGSPTKLWELAKAIGGGLPRRELYAYFKGRKAGYAVELENVRECNPALDPSQLIENFRPPQSFQYLCQTQHESILRAMRGDESGWVMFIAGVHGVGKSTLCAGLVREGEVLHRSAGQIIREADEKALSEDTKAVRDIAHTQKLLVAGVNRLRNGGRKLLLDGHFALLNGSGDVEPVALEVFEALALDRIILVHDSSKEIRNRLISRDKTAPSVSKIVELQSVEVETAEAVAETLAIPLVRVASGDLAGFAKACAGSKALT
tara:strand:- start:49 stop:873 length:825 start_codon:yes stop_codon:yes gene_type:complete